MGGGRSIQLARVLGVRIGVDPSWFIVLFLVIWSLSGSFKNVYPGHDTKAFFLATLAALLFFGSVVLHELGHAVVAMRNGIGIVGIDLWLFGGVARMRGDTKTPGQEFRVAAAGPAVTALVAIASLAAAHLIGGNQYLHGVRLHASHYVNPAVAILSFLAFINVALLVLNLVPGFPLDGGRIARSLVWWRTGAPGRFRGLVSRQKVEGVPVALRPGSSVDQVMTIENVGRFRIGVDEPLEALLGSEGLARLGALMAVDREGVLRGVVTLDQVRRALRAPPVSLP